MCVATIPSKTGSVLLYLEELITDRILDVFGDKAGGCTGCWGGDKAC